MQGTPHFASVSWRAWTTSNTSQIQSSFLLHPTWPGVSHSSLAPLTRPIHLSFSHPSPFSTVLCFVAHPKSVLPFILLPNPARPCPFSRTREDNFFFPLRANDGTGELSWQLRNFLGWVGGRWMLAWGSISLLPRDCISAAATAAKSLQCPTLCDPIDSSPPGSPIPGILQARTLEWVAISFSNAWKWKAKVKSLSCVRLFTTPWIAAYQAPPSMGFSRQEYWSGVPLPSPLLGLASVVEQHVQIMSRSPGA